ncbi:MAG TPA: preprotein translocase subunit SecY [Bdellovibrionota bacterium]|jgi:preprotein translocase subunit SecY|nr:preprotein translocase subunit SecY [Bdellovibrionota bacterium]
MDKNLRSRILWLFGLVLLYKFGTHVPTPGVNGTALSEYFNQAAAGTVFGLLNLFSGGALEQLSIFGLGIAPYISASIIMQLSGFMFPAMERLQKEGESGRRKISQYTRYLTLLIAIIQGFLIAGNLEALTSPVTNQAVVSDGGLSFRLFAVLLLTAGAMFTMWIGEQITEKGIGNGSSIIIFTGIASALFKGISTLRLALENDQLNFGSLVLLGALMVAVIAFIVMVEQGNRKIPITYAKRMVGRKVYGGQDSHLPLKINPAGVMPPIFAQTLLFFPATLVSFVGFFSAKLAEQWRDTFQFHQTNYLFNIIFVLGIFFFAYFYTAIQSNPNDLAENLRKFGGYVPGIRPGKATSDYFDTIITRLVFSGALYMSAVCILPTVVTGTFNVNIPFGGTSLLILVGVALDTMSQLQAHLVNQNYDGFLKQAKLRGRRA